jgi:hypothetical protein
MSIVDSAAGVVSGLLGGRKASKPNLDALFATIKSAGANQRSMIDALPAELRPLYDQYAAGNKEAAADLTKGTDQITDQLMKQTEANYGPEATRAALDAVKGDIYAELPGQQAAIREALAASGGFDRGTASKQLASPVLQAAQKYASAAANITSQQLQAKQQAVQSAISSIANLDSQTLQAKFGLSKEQAMQILTGNRQDLKDQLADLITQSNTETNQTVGVQGNVAMNDYRANVANDAQRAAFLNSVVGLGADVVSGAANPAFLAAINSPSATSSAPAGYNPNAAPNQYASLGY